jgi:hypothetical protein
MITFICYIIHTVHIIATNECRPKNFRRIHTKHRFYYNILSSVLPTHAPQMSKWLSKPRMTHLTTTDKRTQIVIDPNSDPWIGQQLSTRSQIRHIWAVDQAITGTDYVILLKWCYHSRIKNTSIYGVKLTLCHWRGTQISRTAINLGIIGLHVLLKWPVRFGYVLNP